MEGGGFDKQKQTRQGDWHSNINGTGGGGGGGGRAGGGGGGCMNT